MPWILVLFLPPLVLFAVLVRRVVRIGRQLQDPERLRSLFSDELRAALREAGLDPDTVAMEEIQKSEELRRLLAADLRPVLRSIVLGLSLPEAGGGSDAVPRRLDHGSGPSTHGWSPRSSSRPAQPMLPPPIDQPSGPGVRTVLVLAMVGLIALAIFVAGSQP
jgi:hypothetical protein